MLTPRSPCWSSVALHPLLTSFLCLAQCQGNSQSWYKHHPFRTQLDFCWAHCLGEQSCTQSLQKGYKNAFGNEFPSTDEVLEVVGKRG
ncbi:hypothetical protein F5B20DRAFT_565006, partial [Whalleya microplaca]